jgi:hypothetical protein
LISPAIEMSKVFIEAFAVEFVGHSDVRFEHIPCRGRDGNEAIRMLERIEGPRPEFELGPSWRGRIFSTEKSNLSSEGPCQAYVAPVVNSTP